MLRLLLLSSTSCAVVAELLDTSESSPSCLLQTDRQSQPIKTSEEQWSDEDNTLYVEPIQADPHHVSTSAQRSAAFYEVLGTAGKPNGPADMQKTDMNQDKLPKDSRHIDKETWSADWSWEYPPFERSVIPKLLPAVAAARPDAGAAWLSWQDWAALLVLLLFLILVFLICCLVCCPYRRKKDGANDHNAVQHSAPANVASEHAFLREEQLQATYEEAARRNQKQLEATRCAKEEAEQLARHLAEEAKRLAQQLEDERAFAARYREEEAARLNQVEAARRVQDAETTRRAQQEAARHAQEEAELRRRCQQAEKAVEDARRARQAAEEDDIISEARTGYTTESAFARPEVQQEVAMEHVAHPSPVHGGGILESLQGPHVNRQIPTATVAVDANRDGHANYLVTGMDLNRDGIPDSLQMPHATRQIPTATVAVDANRDGHANYLVTGMDLNRDGIPDSLQMPHATGQIPTATVAVDANHDGHANYVVTGVDLNRDGIPDSLQVRQGAWPIVHTPSPRGRLIAGGQSSQMPILPTHHTYTLPTLRTSSLHVVGGVPTSGGQSGQIPSFLRPTHHTDTP